MKIILFISFFILFFISGIAGQDLIITNKGDSLNCKIIEIDNEKIQYSFISNARVINAWIRQDEVKYFSKGFYYKEGADSIKELPKVLIPESRVTFYGGFSRLTGRTNSQVPFFLKSYMENLKTGYHLGASYNYYFTEWLGLGLQGSVFKTKNQIGNISLVYPNGLVRTGMIKDDITIAFLGPAVSARAYPNRIKSFFLFSDFSLGYLGYKNYATVVDDFIIKSKTFGITWDAGIDFPAKNNIAVGIGISYHFGVLKYMEIDDGKTKTIIILPFGQYENISRMDFSLKLNFYQ